MLLLQTLIAGVQRGDRCGEASYIAEYILYAMNDYDIRNDNYSDSVVDGLMVRWLNVERCSHKGQYDL